LKEAELRKYFSQEWPELPSDTVERCVAYYSLVLQENEIQNLTRLVEPRKFWEGFILDVRALLESGLVTFPAMDLGSGAGVPGLLAAIIMPSNWLLVDSEAAKARFIATAAKTLGVEAQVFGERGESVLKRTAVESVVCKAVGPVGRIYSWIECCSTWNSLVLLKGPSWEEEWKEFSATSKQLKLAKTYRYRVGETNERVIVRLERVPRGTSR
jgi:16S rRNA (guanine527-N7)-methyltransferase